MENRRFDSNTFATKTALLFGDDSEATDAALASIEEAGLRCRILDGIETAHLALEDGFADILVFEAGATSPELLTGLLIRMSSYAAETGTPIVASASLEQIDLVAAYLWPAGALLLCQPSDNDRRLAIATALAACSTRILQDNRTSRNRELENLRLEVERIAMRVETFASDSGPFPNIRDASGPAGAVRAEEVRARIRARRLRDKFFDRQLFADPAWDILLDLYSAHLEHRDVSVSSLCIAAATPPTTALRWIGSMTDANLLIRRPDGSDKRRHIITLSETALQAIEQYFAAVEAARIS